MAHEPIKVGSRDRIKGRIRDLVGTTRVPVDLTGTTVALKVRINKGAVKTWNCTPDPDQVVNRGVFSYALGANDIDKAGDIELEAHVITGGETHKSQSVFLTAEKAVS